MNDYHLHTYLCKHGEGHVQDYVQAALQRGLSEIGFAEHIPIPGLDDPDGRMLLDEFEIYQSEIEKAQKDFPDIKIKMGIEADYMPKYMPFIESFLKQHPFDFIIGSVHFIDDWDFTNPAHAEKMNTFGVNETYRSYYRLLNEAANCGLYDIIGHFDIPKKFGKFASCDLTPEIETALDAIKKNNIALDVNTSGIRKTVGEIHPSPDILKKAFMRDIPVVIGSDAHRPQEVAFHFNETVALLTGIGYQHTVSYEKRKPKLTLITDQPISSGI